MLFKKGWPRCRGCHEVRVTPLFVKIRCSELVEGAKSLKVWKQENDLDIVPHAILLCSACYTVEFLRTKRSAALVVPIEVRIN